jgi:hypothetical protein
LVRRPKGDSSSETVPDDIIEILEGDKYGISLDDMLANIKSCNNQQLSDADRDTIYIGDNRYPDCYFTIGYAVGGSLAVPILTPQNEASLPDWVTSTDDVWNGAQSDWCKLDANKDNVAC